MANKPKLNPQVLGYLHERLHKPKSTIRSSISRLKRRFPQATLNAVAQLYAEQHNESVRRLISSADKATIPIVTIEKSPLILKGKSRPKEVIKEILNFASTDYFLKKHLAEINKAYSRHCYTCVFILTRKVFENLIVSILRAKYPSQRDLYYDRLRGRNHDFSVVLENLFTKRNDFDQERKSAIERLNQKLKPFKNDANDKAHSLYHIVEGPKEIDDWNLNTISALISKII